MADCQHQKVSLLYDYEQLLASEYCADCGALVDAHALNETGVTAIDLGSRTFVPKKDAY